MTKTTFSLLMGAVFVLVGLVFGGWWYQGARPQLGLPYTASPTPVPTPQTFIVVGDTGTGLEGQKSVASAMANHCQTQQNCQAVFIAGDVIYEEGVTSVKDPQFQTKFEVPYAQLSIPFYIALGNHDYLGTQEVYKEYSMFSQRFRFPDRYYTQEFDSAVFLVIDTENFDQAQRTWLDGELKKYSTKTKIVVGHRPLFSYEVTKRGENWTGRDELGQILCQQAEFYISGHAHVFESLGKLENCKTQLFVVGTGGAFVRELASPYPGQFGASTLGFLSLHVSYDGATNAEFIDSAGQTQHMVIDPRNIRQY